ncbi:MAG: hypothetical protein OXB88_01685 [Bacteriovoracales bacterium]|nr:hypothetical protein [Bacteriovoracales bacterium]
MKRPNSPNDDTTEQEKEGSLKGLVGIALVIALVIALRIFMDDKSPKLSNFGKESWSIKCQNSEREYRLLSDIKKKGWGISGSLHERRLNLLDENNKTLYRTQKFDRDSLDKEGVWRFHHGKDVRLLAEKDPSNVLYGDEKVFEIAEDFKSMTILTTQGQEKITLSCQAYN